MTEPPRGQALRPEHQDSKEDGVPGQRLVRDVDLGADLLGDAEHHAAEQGAPQRAEAADHHRREREQQDRVGAGGRDERREYMAKAMPPRPTVAKASAAAMPNTCR